MEQQLEPDGFIGSIDPSLTPALNQCGRYFLTPPFGLSRHPRPDMPERIWGS
jgi:hypothetical protein